MILRLRKTKNATTACFVKWREANWLDAGPALMNDEASYLCDSCGEEIAVPIDLSAGPSQEYVEDCPVCCRPNVIHIEIGPDGEVGVWAERE